MSRRFHRGLVVGKFCPLHKGHEHVLRQMLDSCEESVILSYTNPEFPGCEPGKRRHWLTTLFPEARVLVLAEGDHGLHLPANDDDELTHRLFVGQICREVLGITVDAVFTSEDYGDGFARELTRYFRVHEPSHPVVQHVSVDPLRSSFPVSGTALRADVHELRQWLPPVVNASFIQRICLLGGESSGKSTLAAALAARFNTLHVAEYGRELWEQQGGVLRYEDLRIIATTQVAREDAACEKACRHLFCDTSPLTTLFYSQAMFGKADPFLHDLSRRPYYLQVLCAPDFLFVQDGTRRDDAFRQEQHRWYVEQLSANRLPWIEVAGSVEQRVAQVGEALKSPVAGRA